MNDLLFFLTFGESAPCKSIVEAKNLPIDERDALVKRLSDAYQRQKEEMDRASRKGKGGKITQQY